MVISAEKRSANFSSVTDSEPFLSARLIFFMDWKTCHLINLIIIEYIIYIECTILECTTYHVPEGGTCTLGSLVVFQDGCVVDQFPNVLTATHHT